MARRHSRAEAEIEQLLGRLDPDSERYRVLAAARDFKASWVELGEQLTRVREEGHYREWGYDLFEAYCRRELRLRAETANKLTRSFSYLRDHEPAALTDHHGRELPALDVVDLMSQARERAHIAPGDLDTIREEVFGSGAPPTRQEVLRRFRELDPEAFKPAEAKPRDASEGPVELRKALLLAERLCALLEAGPAVSAKSLSSLRTLVRELKERFDESRAAPEAPAES